MVMREALAMAVAETFEGMLFLEALPSDVPESSRSVLWARVPVLEPAAGEVTLLCPPGLAQAFAEVLTSGCPGGAMDPEIACRVGDGAERLQRDVLAELGNTLAGRLLERLVPELRSFRLGLPETGTGHPAGRGGHESFGFLVSGEIFHVRVSGGLEERPGDGRADG